MSSRNGGIKNAVRKNQRSQVFANGRPRQSHAWDKKHLMQRWEGLTKGTLDKWLIEMRDNPKFEHGVQNPTHKIVFIDYGVFREFVQWKEKTRYRKRG